MSKLSKIFLIHLLVFLAIWLIPWSYAFLTSRPEGRPFTLYSAQLGRFMQMEVGADRKMYWMDDEGVEYSDSQGDSLLPCFYMRQLVGDGLFPDSICGREVNPAMVRMHNFIYSHRPMEVNSPSSGLYFLMETSSGRVDLKMPSDVCSLGKEGMMFYDMESNRENEQLGKVFTDVLNDEGFSFPARFVAANTTTHKSYDNGFLIIDSAGELFNLRRVKNLPSVRRIELPDGLNPVWAAVTEYEDHATLGYICSDDNKFYVVGADGDITLTGLPTFNPFEDEILLIGNMFAHTVRLDRNGKTTYFALDAHDFSLLKSMEVECSSVVEIPGLSFTSPYDGYVRPRF